MKVVESPDAWRSRVAAAAPVPDENALDETDGADEGGRVRVDAGDVPEIWTDVVIAHTVDATVNALRADPEIFIRGGKAVRVIESDGTDPGPERERGAPVIRRASSLWLLERASLHARFMKRKTTGQVGKKKQTPVQIAPPKEIAAHVLARETWPGYRALNGVVTSPTMRRDGSVLQEAGYDRDSTLLYIPRGNYPRVPDAPTRDDALAARDRLLDVILDFPLSDLGRAGWLSMLLTLVARELVEGQAPLFAIDAHSAGSGKGLTARCAHVIAYGADIAHMSMPTNDEEMRKQITTTLLSGDPALLLDNVSVPLGGDSLEALVTAPIWKTRVLGKTEDSGALTVRLVTIATGNGLQFVGDMGRRALRILLSTPHESPEERDDYQHRDRAGEDKLLAWVRAHRAALVVDALTILRAWHVDGRNGEVKPWGSFASWAATIGKCVQWIGLPDPTLGRATQDVALDPQRQALSVVYDAIKRLGIAKKVTDDGVAQLVKGITAGTLVNAAFEPSSEEHDLAEAIGTLAPNSRDAPSRARVLGRKLIAGRIVDGHVLVTTPARSRVVRYSVEPCGSGE